MISPTHIAIQTEHHTLVSLTKFALTLAKITWNVINKGLPANSIFYRLFYNRLGHSTGTKEHTRVTLITSVFNYYAIFLSVWKGRQFSNDYFCFHNFLMSLRQDMDE